MMAKRTNPGKALRVVKSADREHTLEDAAPAPEEAEAVARTRGRPHSDDPKDRVLQTRVPKGLYEDLVTQARRLRVPVSNLVRNILEDSVRMVENIVDGGLDIAEALAKPGRDFDPSVVAGWQPMVANRRLTCAKCRKPIRKGDDSFLSVGEPNGRVHTICRSCQCEI